MDRYAAPIYLHEEAIYIHGGQQHQVEKLDWEEKKAYVRQVAVDYYTDAELAVHLQVTDVFAQEPGEGSPIQHAERRLDDCQPCRGGFPTTPPCHSHP